MTTGGNQNIGSNRFYQHTLKVLPNEGQTVFSFDKIYAEIKVYFNGIKLIRNIHYTQDDTAGTIALIGIVSKLGDVMEIEHTITAAKENITYIETYSRYLSQTAAVAIINGNISLGNTIKTKNFSLNTYTGTGATLTINSGIPSIDFTVSNNGTGYWYDKVNNVIKTDGGTISKSGLVAANISQVHIKSRSATTGHFIFDGLRGVLNRISTESTGAETSLANSLTAFTESGFTLGAAAGINVSSATYVYYQKLFTHIRWGVTSADSLYIEAFNPVTKEGMILYSGSATAEHIIPHSISVKPKTWTTKAINTSSPWVIHLNDAYGSINDNASFITSDLLTLSNEYEFTVTDSGATNIGVNGNYKYIAMYNSDSPTWGLFTYTGSDVTPQTIVTKDYYGNIKKPARVIIKSTSNTSNWFIHDCKREVVNTIDHLLLNTSAAQATPGNGYKCNIVENGIMINPTGEAQEPGDINVDGATYIAIVEYDTDNDNSGSYFDKAGDTTRVIFNNVALGYTKSIDNSGFVNSKEAIPSYSLDLGSAPDGLYCLYKIENDGYGLIRDITFGDYNRTHANDNRYIFDADTGKWYTATTDTISIKDTELPKPISQIAKVMYTGGIAQYIDTTWEPIHEVMRNVFMERIETKQLIVNGLTIVANKIANISNAPIFTLDGTTLYIEY